MEFSLKEISQTEEVNGGSSKKDETKDSQEVMVLVCVHLIGKAIYTDIREYLRDVRVSAN
jgi:hypothetical protein